MPYIDNDNVMSDEQAVTASAASTDVIDLGAAGASNARDLRLVVDVTEAVTASGGATVTFQLQTDSVSGFGSVQTLVETAAIGKATLVAGYRAWEITLPKDVLRYVRVYYSVGSGPLTAGKFKAYLAQEA